MNCWVLTDLERDIWVESIDLDASALGLPEGSGVRITKRCLRGGVREGVDILTVDNGLFALTFVPTRGMGIWSGKFQDMRIGWHSPVQHPVNPAFVKMQERGGLGWLDGFGELICRCGLASNGPPGPDERPNPDGSFKSYNLTLHGRVANQPAARVVVSVDPGRGTITVEATVDEGGMYDDRLRLTTCATTTIGSNCWTLSDRITNMGGTATESQLLYHCNFGQPLLGGGSRVSLPARQVVPRDPVTAADPNNWDSYSDPLAGSSECCYFIEPIADSEGRVPVLLRNAEGDRAVQLTFNARQLPCFSLWKHCADGRDGYATGLEPATNYPNPRSFERTQGRVRRLDAGESYDATLTLTALDGKDAIAAALQHIEGQQGSTATVVHSAPVAGFCSN